jgi:hypothetical protein
VTDDRERRARAAARAPIILAALGLGLLFLATTAGSRRDVFQASGYGAGAIAAACALGVPLVRARLVRRPKPARIAMAVALIAAIALMPFTGGASNAFGNAVVVGFFGALQLARVFDPSWNEFWKREQAAIKAEAAKSHADRILERAHAAKPPADPPAAA